MTATTTAGQQHSELRRENKVCSHSLCTVLEGAEYGSFLVLLSFFLADRMQKMNQRRISVINPNSSQKWSQELQQQKQQQH